MAVWGVSRHYLAADGIDVEDATTGVGHGPDQALLDALENKLDWIGGRSADGPVTYTVAPDQTLGNDESEVRG